jgi:hypothetical protein
MFRMKYYELLIRSIVLKASSSHSKKWSSLPTHEGWLFRPKAFYSKVANITIFCNLFSELSSANYCLRQELMNLKATLV